MTVSNSNICEINILSIREIKDECNIRLSNMTSEMWIKLKQTNSYLYVLPTKQNVYIECEERTYYENLIDTGIIVINPSCKIKTDALVIIGFQTITETKHKHLTPSIKMNLSKYILYGKEHNENR